MIRYRKVTVNDTGLLERLRSGGAEPHGNDATRMRLQIALGKALDDLGQYAEAMLAFDAAAAIRERTWPVDIAAFERRVTRSFNDFQRMSSRASVRLGILTRPRCLFWGCHAPAPLWSSRSFPPTR
jgi:hypothetical protein